MRKVRLTEADLTRLIRRVIQEQPVLPYQPSPRVSSKPNPFPSVQPGGKPRMDVSGAFMTNNIITCMGVKDLPQACKSFMRKVTGSDNKLSLNNLMGSMKDFGMCDKALGNEESINKFGACLMKEIKK
jgi:hypothetical protein